jgi:predicted alpha/beta-fold hydrolase
MPLVETSTYRPPFWLPNGHAQSIYPALFRKVPGVTYQRERLMLPDGDFLDLDWRFAGEKGEGSREKEFPNKLPFSLFPAPFSPLVILSHGLEGDSRRQYILGMVRLLNAHGFDCLAWNFRSCSGEINSTLRFYHSGATDDLEAVVTHARGKGYQRLVLVGFSLGGNLTLKYLGEQAKKAVGEIERAVVFSVPLHLSSGSTRMESWEDRVYTARFNRTLKRKIAEKAARMPDKIDVTHLANVRTLRDFDNYYTSQLHGFKDAEDYYEQNSSIHFVDRIELPTLIVNAQNDPFLSRECYPFELVKPLPNVWLEVPSEGGHCGFLQAGYRGVLWSEERALAFLTRKEN